MRGNIQHRKEQIHDLPTTARYAMTQGKEHLKRPGQDFKTGIAQAKDKRQQANMERTAIHRQTIAEKRQALEKKQKQATVSTKTHSHQRSKTSENTRPLKPSQPLNLPRKQAHLEKPQVRHGSVQTQPIRNNRHLYSDSDKAKKQVRNKPSSLASTRSQDNTKRLVSKQPTVPSQPRPRLKQYGKRPLRHGRRNRR